jgi:hypothetical protein
MKTHLDWNHLINNWSKLAPELAKRIKTADRPKAKRTNKSKRTN